MYITKFMAYQNHPNYQNVTSRYPVIPHKAIQFQSAFFLNRVAVDPAAGDGVVERVGGDGVGEVGDVAMANVVVVPSGVRYEVLGVKESSDGLTLSQR